VIKKVVSVKNVDVRNVTVHKNDRILQHMISIPVSKPRKQYTCGVWQDVYPPIHSLVQETTIKENKKNESKKDIRGRWKLGVQYEPWEA
jgi:hypothetical protein